MHKWVVKWISPCIRLAYIRVISYKMVPLYTVSSSTSHGFKWSLRNCNILFIICSQVIFIMSVWIYFLLASCRHCIHCYSKARTIIKKKKTTTTTTLNIQCYHGNVIPIQPHIAWCAWIGTTFEILRNRRCTGWADQLIGTIWPSFFSLSKAK